MNEIIKNLFIQAGGGVEEENGNLWTYSDNLDPELFGQLVVRECANHCDLLLDHKINSEWSRGTHDCSKAIKKHFGVKE